MCTIHTYVRISGCLVYQCTAFCVTFLGIYVGFGVFSMNCMKNVMDFVVYWYTLSWLRGIMIYFRLHTYIRKPQKQLFGGQLRSSCRGHAFSPGILRTALVFRRKLRPSFTLEKASLHFAGLRLPISIESAHSQEFGGPIQFPNDERENEPLAMVNPKGGRGPRRRPICRGT